MKWMATLFAAMLMSLAACSGVKGLKEPYVYNYGDFSKIDYIDSLCLADLEWWKFYSDSTLCSLLDSILRCFCVQQFIHSWKGSLTQCRQQRLGLLP